jgi:RHS repeat-associated protein
VNRRTSPTISLIVSWGTASAGSPTRVRSGRTPIVTTLQGTSPARPGSDGATLNLLDYTAFNLPLRIQKTGGLTAAAAANFYYDAGYQCVQQVKFDAANVQVDDILYVVPGGFEVRRNEAGQVKSSTATISGPDGSVATVTTNYDVATGLATGGGSGINTTSPISGANTITKLLLKDHLGSMVAEVTITGALSARQVSSVSLVANTFNVHGFGPWGNARNLSSPLNGDNRGFTGHEHLAELGLIHMNGRIYDPVIGRFLQADPIIQAPQNAQSHNRYSYVMNNPLSFTDPSGFSSWTKFRDRILKPVLAIAFAYFIGPMIANWASFAALDAGIAVGSEIAFGNAVGAIASGFASGGITGGNIQSALQGAFFGGILNIAATGLGLHGAAAFGSAKHAGQIALHAAVGCAQGAAAGGSCKAGALAGGTSAFASPALNSMSGGGKLIASSIIGGVASKLGGGKFENGAITAAFGYLLNEDNFGFNFGDNESRAAELMNTGQLTQLSLCDQACGQTTAYIEFLVKDVPVIAIVGAAGITSVTYGSQFVTGEAAAALLAALGIKDVVTATIMAMSTIGAGGKGLESAIKVIQKATTAVQTSRRAQEALRKTVDIVKKTN